ncbi:Transcriptional regulatory protein MoaR1 [Streptomyces sp. Go-475]|nr:Transcriptional regulatory protein MoaR1 [Streptomyces sp. Go-475]
MRSVLATLLVHADQVVPVSSLIRELWDEEPPVSCLTTLQTYILNLRKLLASATGMTARQVAAEILVTRSGGYLFRTTQGDLDVHRFHQLVADGRRALSSGDDHAALSTLSSALQACGADPRSSTSSPDGSSKGAGSSSRSPGWSSWSTSSTPSSGSACTGRCSPSSRR